MMKKRGQIEIQFNWIFVLAVGAIILIFFTSVILKYRDSSEDSTNIEITRSLEGIFTGAEVSKGTVNKIDVPKVNVEFDCDGFRVGKAFKKMEMMNVFSSFEIKTNELLTWTLDWSVPFRTTNFIYIIDPNMRYVLIGENELSESVYDMIPEHENFHVILVNDANAEDLGHKKVRLVFFNGGVNDGTEIPDNFKKFNDKLVTAVKVTGDESSGSLEFFRKKGNIFVAEGTSYYLQPSSLIGAMIVDRARLYNCVMEAAFKKLNIVTSVYQKKTENIFNYYNSIGDSCSTYHSVGNLNLIMSASRSFNYANIQNILAGARALNDQNRQAERHTCAMIY